MLGVLIQAIIWPPCYTDKDRFAMRGAQLWGGKPQIAESDFLGTFPTWPKSFMSSPFPSYITTALSSAERWPSPSIHGYVPTQVASSWQPR